jgi:hypothetical protein
MLLSLETMAAPPKPVATGLSGKSKELNSVLPPTCEKPLKYKNRISIKYINLMLSYEEDAR